MSTSLITPPIIAENMPIMAAMAGSTWKFSAFSVPRMVNMAIPKVSNMKKIFLKRISLLKNRLVITMDAMTT